VTLAHLKKHIFVTKIHCTPLYRSHVDLAVIEELPRNLDGGSRFGGKLSSGGGKFRPISTQSRIESFVDFWKNKY
jgi:hypothetical protein